MQKAFDSLRNWLSEIYRSIKVLLGIHELSPDVSEVFDAFLATEDEIAKSGRAVQSAPDMETQGTLAAMGTEVTPELLDKYQKPVEKARANASAVIANRRLVARRAAMRAFRAEAAEEINKQEPYPLLWALSQQGIPFEALKENISEDLAYKLQEKWHD